MSGWGEGGERQRSQLMVMNGETLEKGKVNKGDVVQG